MLSENEHLNKIMGTVKKSLIFIAENKLKSFKCFKDQQ